MAFSIAGSVAGGGLNSRLPPMKSLLVASCLECIPQLGRWALSVYPHPPAASDVIGLICFEAFTGGLLTTVMFCFMMSQVGDKGIGASHTKHALFVQLGMLSMFQDHKNAVSDCIADRLCLGQISDY